MTAPRLEVDLAKVEHNARTLVDRLAGRGISVTGVTKAMLGSPELARAMLRGGVIALGDSRIENIETLRLARVPATMVLLRSPMISQVEQVVAFADLSFNTELEVLSKLSLAAEKAGRLHGVVLMVELGDLREGIMPTELEAVVRETLRLPGLALHGLGTNLACRSGVCPDPRNMDELSALADAMEATFGPVLGQISGGNSANLPWAFGAERAGRINNLRLGEAILLGREPLHRTALEDLHTDAITLVAEVVESKYKPSQPWGETAQAAFGAPPVVPVRGPWVHQALLALGRQDVDPAGLSPPPGMDILGCSSDHLIVNSGPTPLCVGAEVCFQLDYSALLRAMTSPFVARVFSAGLDCTAASLPGPDLAREGLQGLA